MNIKVLLLSSGLVMMGTLALASQKVLTDQASLNAEYKRQVDRQNKHAHVFYGQSPRVVGLPTMSKFFDVEGIRREQARKKTEEVLYRKFLQQQQQVDLDLLDEEIAKKVDEEAARMAKEAARIKQEKEKALSEKQHNNQKLPSPLPLTRSLPIHSAMDRLMQHAASSAILSYNVVRTSKGRLLKVTDY